MNGEETLMGSCSGSFRPPAWFQPALVPGLAPALALGAVPCPGPAPALGPVPGLVPARLGPARPGLGPAARVDLAPAVRRPAPGPGLALCLWGRRRSGAD